MKSTCQLDGNDSRVLIEAFQKILERPIDELNRIFKNANKGFKEPYKSIEGFLAIASGRGEMLAIWPTPNPPQICFHIAQEKTVTAAWQEQTSYEFGKKVANRLPPYLSDVTPPGVKFSTFQGGVPILINGLIVGAVAFSGLDAPDDEVLVHLILKEFQHLSSCSGFTLDIPVSENIKMNTSGENDAHD